MANIAKLIFRGAATTTLGTTLYTVPASTSTVVTNIVITNTSSADATYDISLAGIKLASGSTVPANGMTIIDIKQVLTTTTLIAGGASSTSVNFHISGIEVS